MFGYAILNNDYEMSEWGNISFLELVELKIKHPYTDKVFEVERDLAWYVRKASKVDDIVKGRGIF